MLLATVVGSGIMAEGLRATWRRFRKYDRDRCRSVCVDPVVQAGVRSFFNPAVTVTELIGKTSRSAMRLVTLPHNSPVQSPASLANAMFDLPLSCVAKGAYRPVAMAERICRHLV
jgi:hypothetical protein